MPSSIAALFLACSAAGFDKQNLSSMLQSLTAWIAPENPPRRIAQIDL
jgi:hypothetical protein